MTRRREASIDDTSTPLVQMHHRRIVGSSEPKRGMSNDCGSRTAGHDIGLATTDDEAMYTTRTAHGYTPSTNHTTNGDTVGEQTSDTASHDTANDAPAPTRRTARRAMPDRRHQQGDPSVARLVEDHLWLADQLAAHMWRRFPPHVDRAELRAAALLGLTEAARRFDPTVGTSFASYASSRVRGEILQVARSADLAPRRLRREIRVITEAGERLGHVLGRPPSVEELASSIGMEVDLVRERLADQARTSIASLDVEGATQPMAARESSDPLDALTTREMHGTIRQAVEGLPEPLRTVIIRTHWNEERLIDVAADMGVSFQRVAQYKVEAFCAIGTWLSMIDDSVAAPTPGSPGVNRRSEYCAEMCRTSTWRSRIDRALDANGPSLRSATG